jgi:HSP20 family protein
MDDLFSDFASSVWDTTPFMGLAEPTRRDVTVWGTPDKMRLDFVERDDHYAVHVDLPGIPKEDVKINLDGDMLSISAERSMQRQEEQENYQIMERQYGKMQRSIRLPQDVNLDAAEAHYENGVLNLKLPRVQKLSEKTRSIEIH